MMEVIQMKKMNLNDIKSNMNEVPSQMLKQINGGHLLYTDYYNACTGKFIRTERSYYNGCKCETVVMRKKKYI